MPQLAERNLSDFPALCQYRNFYERAKQNSDPDKNKHEEAKERRKKLRTSVSLYGYYKVV